MNLDLAHVDEPVDEGPQPEFLQVDLGGDGIRRGHRTSRHARGFKRLIVGAITPHSDRPGKPMAAQVSDEQ
jgi:hypothetical protein